MPAFSGQARRSRQHHILAGSMYGISPEQLRAFIHVNENNENTDDSNLDRKHRVLTLDCRSFVAYNNGHIVDSVNVHCPAILRRRCGGRLPLRTLIPNSNIRTSLTNNQCFPVVLYDDYGLNVKNLSDMTGEESTATFVAKCLRNETDLKTIYYLEGGFQNFSRLYPELVTQTPCHSPCASPCQSPRPLSGGGGGPVEILSHLYLGSARDAARKEQLQQLGVTALLNVTQLCPNLFQEAFLYKCIPVRDTGGEDIAAHFHEAINFIDQVKAQNGKVLVHCQAGISRSATICIAYLMATKRLRMEEAYKYVKSRRKIVSPNFSFMGQLLSFENQIFSSSGSRYHQPSPGSPLLAVDASTPDPDTLTPSSSASQRNVFDFRPIPNPPEETVSSSTAVSENEYVTASIVDPCHKLSLSPCLT
ncbi:dual specificity protein phosphatase 1-like [Argiope bruennichi]|uniref:Dual specificity protein phosphatase 4 like protein n=1 Tax=Argiope bruennichi TaxID=94029 RepID=A0A8T0EB36_ARGBR|nr:dual specificity protein phosphatase 1-like [Argiope bruennichi]KAF8767405.1 Dual specificity protein phosphatase 4 like protein [Argiope bruennichi]